MRQLKITQSITSRDTKALEKYLKEVSRREMITADEEVELAIKIREGDDSALQKLVSANLRFVISVAKQYQGNGLPLLDLINEGNLGLIKAAKRFDESKGFKFISYAVWWIRQSIMQAIGEHSRMVRLPFNQIGEMRKINQAFIELEQKYERAPTESELAEILDMPELKVKNAMKQGKKHSSLDAPVKEDSLTSLQDMLENTHTKKPDDRMKSEDLQTMLNPILKQLTPKEKIVMQSLYGLHGKKKKTVNDLSMELEISPARVRQIKVNAIRKMRKPKNLKALRTYL